VKAAPTLRIGLVGAGQVAVRHAEAYAANPHAEVVAVVDPLLQRAESLASRYGAFAGTSYEDLLGSGTVDAISVCVPHDLHLPVTLAASEAGVDMLMEKPISNTLEEADQMLAAVERAGVTMMIGFVHRFRTEVLEAKRVLQEGTLGEPTTFLDKFCSLGGIHPPSWVWNKAQAGGGVLMYGGIHALDRMLWLLETHAVSVTARSHNYAGFGDVEDGLAALVELANGASAALFENSPPYGRPGGWSTEIFGSEGSLRIQTGAWVELTTSTRSFVLESKDEGHFGREIDEFVNALIEGREPTVPAAVGRETLALALAIYDSAAAGEPVALGT
jgi:predicted dehydrogenase